MTEITVRANKETNKIHMRVDEAFGFSITAEEADALIAALREARDALVADGAEDVKRSPFTSPPKPEMTDEELEAVFAPAAPVRETPRLTRAQRELLERIDRAPDYPFTASSSVWRRTQALLNRKLIAQGRQEPGHRPICILTNAGRAALAAAQRGDAIRAPRGETGRRGSERTPAC